MMTDKAIITKCSEPRLHTAMTVTTLALLLQPTAHNCIWEPQLKPLFRD